MPSRLLILVSASSEFLDRGWRVSGEIRSCSFDGVLWKPAGWTTVGYFKLPATEMAWDLVVCGGATRGILTSKRMRAALAIARFAAKG